MNYVNPLVNYDLIIETQNIDPYLYILHNNGFSKIKSRGGSPSYQRLMQDVANYGINNDLIVYGFVYKPFGGQPRLFLDNKCDYLIIENFGDYDLDVNAYNYDMNQNTSELLDSYFDIGLVNSQQYYNEFNYDIEEFYGLGNGYSTSLVSYDACLFDYNLSGYLDVYNIGNLSFYSNFFYLGSTEISYYFNLQLGSNYSGAVNQAYTNGYENGRGVGYQEGLHDGYEAGQQNNISYEPATAFDYIGNAFNAVGGIMSLEILPNITLGLCFSIPLVLILIMTIFKLVRK